MAIGTGAAILGGSLVSGAFGMIGANKQASAAKSAAGLQQQQYQQTREDLAPYRGAGSAALYELSSLYGLPIEGGYPGANDQQQQDQTSTATGRTPLTIPQLAGWGRNGDTEVAHVTPGEAVVPASVMNQPTVRNALATGYRSAGLNPGQYVVGGRDDSRNPMTGMREYADYGTSGQDYGGYHGDISGGNYGAGNPRDPYGAAGRNLFSRNGLAGNSPIATNPSSDINPVSSLPEDYYTQQAAIDRFYQSPDYRLAFDEGQKAIERSAAARGGLFSGNTLAALTRYGQQLGGNLYGQYYNRLANLAGLGESAATQTGNFGAQAAANTGNALVAAGNAQAGGWEGIGNAINSGLSNYLLYNYLGNA